MALQDFSQVEEPGQDSWLAAGQVQVGDNHLLVRLIKFKFNILASNL